MSDLDVALDLGRVRVFSVPDLLTYFIMGTTELRGFAGAGELNTDDNALIEFHAPRSLHFETRQENRREIQAHAGDPLALYVDKPSTPELVALHYQDMAEAFLGRKMYASAARAIDKALSLHDSEEGRILQARIHEAEEKKSHPSS
jgi:hypothetical protein